jgi:hypothetical protein
VITLERKPLFRATSNIHDPAGTGWQIFVRMNAQKIRKPADMVPVAVGYEDRIYGRRVDAEPFHIAEEDVAPGPGIEQEGLPGSLHQTGKSPVGRQGRLPGNIVIDDSDFHGQVAWGCASVPEAGDRGYRVSGE